MVRGHVVVLGEVLGHVVQLPAFGVEAGELLGGDRFAEALAGLGERRARPRAHRTPAVLVDRPVAEHLEVLGVMLRLALPVLQRRAKLTPWIGDCVTPRIVFGGSTPSRSSTVGTMSMMWAYWARTSPLDAIPFGQWTMNGSDTPPR